MFSHASAFNQPIGKWNTGAVKDTQYMLGGASAFNQAIGNWNTSAIQDMHGMFAYASSFNESLCAWGPHIAAVANVLGMFAGTSCPSQSDPVLGENPVSPLCFICGV